MGHSNCDQCGHDRNMCDCANRTQVGGSHYAGYLQHWDLVRETEMGYLEGNATKYVFRYKKKNGLQDLEKAQHYVKKLIENVDRHFYEPNRKGSLMVRVRKVQKFCDYYKMPENESLFIGVMATWSSKEELKEAQRILRRIIHAQSEPE